MYTKKNGNTTARAGHLQNVRTLQEHNDQSLGWQPAAVSFTAYDVPSSLPNAIRWLLGGVYPDPRLIPDPATTTLSPLMFSPVAFDPFFPNTPPHQQHPRLPSVQAPCTPKSNPSRSRSPLVSAIPQLQHLSHYAKNKSAVSGLLMHSKGVSARRKPFVIRVRTSDKNNIQNTSPYPYNILSGIHMFSLKRQP